MSLVENILSETRPTNIVSEQHDPTAINFVAGLSDPGEMIACGYRPELRRHEGESDEVYAARIRPLVMALPQDKQNEIMGAAIKRAGLDASNGKVAVMVAGKSPWHQLGVNVAHAVSRAEAKQLSGQNFTVSKRTLSYAHNGLPVEQAQSYAIVRDDTGAFLGAVGSDYSVVQIDDGYDVLDAVLGEFGANYETAGVLHGGKKVWILANLPESVFTVGDGDEVVAYCIFTNPHDGSGKAWVYPTSERVVCANTLRRSFGERDKGFGIRHSGSIKDKIDQTKLALAQSVQGFRDFKEEAQQLARVRVPNVSAYVDSVLDEVLPLKAKDVALGAEGLARTRARQDVTPEEFELCVRTAEREIRSRAEMWDDIIGRFNSERCNVHGVGGTIWAALQSVTEYADHSAPKRNTGTPEARESRRFESVLAGDRDTLKQVAYQQALALAN